MNFDLLLYWATHTGEGSWPGFKKAVSVLAPDAPDQAALARRLRVTFSDLAHIDFFIDGTQRWRACPPILAGITDDSSSAVLCGSRTQGLLVSLQAASSEFACVLSTAPAADGPSRITIAGSAPDIQRAANRAQIGFVPRASTQLLASVDSIAHQLDSAPHEPLPLNWDAESFDLKTRTWIEGVLPNSACRFTPRYGALKFLLHKRRQRFLRLRKREAVYASAMLQGVPLLSYDPASQVLTAPLAAPMPEKLARAACLCSGAQPLIDHGALTYANVPFDIASAVLTTAGQPYEVAGALDNRRRFSVGQSLSAF